MGATRAMKFYMILEIETKETADPKDVRKLFKSDAIFLDYDIRDGNVPINGVRIIEDSVAVQAIPDAIPAITGIGIVSFGYAQ